MTINTAKLLKPYEQYSHNVWQHLDKPGNFIVYTSDTEATPEAISRELEYWVLEENCPWFKNLISYVNLGEGYHRLKYTRDQKVWEEHNLEALAY